MMKMQLSVVLVHLLVIITGSPSTTPQDQLQFQGFPKAFLFNATAKVTLPIGSYIIRALVAGGGGGGCYSIYKGRGVAGQVLVHVFTISINQTRTETVIVGTGSDEASINQAGQPANSKTKSRIFGLTAEGGATCKVRELKRKTFESFFISRISYGSPGNDSTVRGGQGGILINSTGPTAQRGAKVYSSEGGVGYGAGGGSGGMIKKGDGETEMSTGGKGAPGVVYIEVLPKICQEQVRVMFALDASANLFYQRQNVYCLLRDFFALSKGLVKVSLMGYRNTSSIVTIDQKNLSLLRAKTVQSLKRIAASPSKVNFENLLTSAIKEFREKNSHNDKYTKTLVIFTNETKVDLTENMNTSKETLRRMGVKILVIGLAKTDSPSREEKLQQLTFKEGYVFVERRVNGLVSGTMMSAIANLICRASLHYPSVPTTTSSPPTRPENPSEQLQKDYDYILNYNITESDPNDSSTVKHVMSIAGNLIRNSDRLPNATEDAPGLKVLQFLEDYGLNMATKLVIESNKNRSYKYFEHQEIGLLIGSYKVSSAKQLTLPQFSAISNAGHVTLPKEAFGASDRGSVVWVTVDPVMSMKQDNNSVIRSKIMMLNVQPKANHTFERPVELTFTINKVNLDQHQQNSCEFWDSSKRSSSSLHGAWSSEGCKVTSENKTSLACQCNHLTSFAVLTRIVTRKESPGVHEKYLSIITYVGCALSMLGCVLTIAIHACLPSLRTERTFIHLNLVTAIFIAQCLFLIAVSVQGPKGLCFAVAISLYLFYLCVFTWMLVEGLHIYCLVIRVFHSGHERKRLYAIIGWVFPLIITIISAASFREDFVAHNICWLSTETGAIWAFVGPALVIIAVNLVILILVLRVTATVMIKDETQNNSNKSLIKACITLLPILGLTWLFGVLAINNKTLVFEYLFCIFNSSQGLLIFLFYCIGSSEVRRECKRKLHNYETKRSLRNSSNGQFKPNKQNNSNCGKITRSAELISQRDVNDDTRL